MSQDWRFSESPHVKIGGLRSYAGSPLRCRTGFNDHVALGSVCVASNTVQETLTRPQKMALTHVSDWITFEIVQSAGVRRQQERRRMLELASTAQKDLEETGSEKSIFRALETLYPNAVVSTQPSQTRQISLDGRPPISHDEFEHCLWEDVEYVDEIIHQSNHLPPASKRPIRVIAAEYEDMAVSSFLVVASIDLKHVFDDVDAWFVETCAGMLSRHWQKRALHEASMAKEKFLRGITHQLRTPIHGILGSLDLLSEELGKNRRGSQATLESIEQNVRTHTLDWESTQAHINTIRSAGHALTSVVDSLITLNRWADVSKVERTDTLHTADDLELLLSNETFQKTPWNNPKQPPLFFSHKFPPLCDGVWIDSRLFLDSMIPLLLNAMYNTPVDEAVAITISMCPDQRHLIVDVEDTGGGIHLDEQKRIFRAFEKIDEYSSGAGLGLTLASKYSELLNGKVELVRSELGHGSHFRVTFCNVRYAWSEVQQPPSAELFVPLAVHVETSRVEDGARSSLCNFAARCFMNRNLQVSEDKRAALRVLEYIPEADLRRKCFDQISPGQVAICLIPASKNPKTLEDNPKNVIYMVEPFSTASLNKILDRADAMLRQSIPYRTPLSNSDDEAESYFQYPKPNVPQTPAQSEIQGEDYAESVQSVPEAPLPPEPAEMFTTVKPVLPIVGSSKPSALLVDDNAINLRILQVFCKKRALPFQSATDGQQAIDLYISESDEDQTTNQKKDNFELVLMDLQMPVCDGIEATRQIRAHEKKHGLKPCILFIVTGQDSPNDRLIAREAGADEFFVKPLGMKTLDRAIRQYFPAYEGG